MAAPTLDSIYSALQNNVSSQALVLSDTALGLQANALLDALTSTAFGGNLTINNVTLNHDIAATILIRGTTSLLGANIQISAAIQMVNSSPQLTFKVPVPADWNFGSGFLAVGSTLLNKIGGTDVYLVFSTYDYLDSTLSSQIGRGLNYVGHGVSGSFSMDGTGEKRLTFPLPMNQLDGVNVLGLDTVIQFIGRIDPLQLALIYNSKRSPAASIALTSLSSFTAGGNLLTWRNLTLTVNTAQANIGAAMSLAVSSVVLDFQLTTSVLSGSSGPAAAISLKLYAVRQTSDPWAAPTNQTALWQNPFGISGVSIEAVALAISVARNGLTLAVAGQIKMGSIVLSVSAGCDATTAPRYLTASLQSGGGSDGIPLTLFLNQLLTVAGLSSISSILDQFKLNNFTMYLVAPGATQPSPLDSSIIYKEGVTVHAKVSVFGFSAAMDLEINPKTGVDASATCDKVKLGPLAITDAAGSGGPLLKLKTSDPSHLLTVDGSVSLFNSPKATTQLTASTSPLGLALNVNIPAAYCIAAFGLSGTLGTSGLDATASLNLNLPDARIPVSVAGVHFFDLSLDGVSVSVALGVKAGSSGVTLTFSSSVKFQGQVYSFSATTTQSPSDLGKLPQLLLDLLIEKAADVFKDLLSNLNNLMNLAKAGVISLADTAGAVLRNSYNKAADEALQLLRQGGVLFQDAGVMLGLAYDISASTISRTLKEAGYAVGEVSAFLESAYGMADAAVGTALRLGGYVADDVVGALHTTEEALQYALAYSAWASGSLLTDASNVANRITDVTRAAAGVAAAALDDSGYAISEVGNAIKNGLGREYVLSAIAGVYQIGDVATYARDVLGAGADEVVSFCKSGLGMTKDQVQTALQGVGYTTSQIEGAWNSGYDWAASHLNPTRW